MAVPFIHHYFYRHSDHLGSANWITDQDGHAVQYLHYLPYGQMLLNQQAGGYNGSDNLRSYRFRMVRVYRQFVFWLVR